MITAVCIRRPREHPALQLTGTRENTMESFNYPCANPERRVHVRLIVVAAVLTLVIPGILAGQSLGVGSTRDDSVRATAATSTP